MNLHVNETFRFCPSCGAKSSENGASPFQCTQCDYCFYFSPATAVGGIVVDANRELLLLIRARDPGKGKYGLPGGFADAGESLETSLNREIFEETGLTVSQSEYLCSFPNSYTHREITIDVLDAFYLCQVDSFDKLSPQPDEVASFYRGPATDEVLSNMAFASNRLAIEHFLQTRS